MNIHFQRKGLIATRSVAISAAVLLGLAACGERTDDTAAGARKDANEARQETREAGKEVREAAKDVREASRDAASSANQAASSAATAVMGAAGRVGEKVDDMQITARVNAGLAADKDLSALRIDVDTRDGVVTLMGTAPSASAKARAEEIARNAKDVKSVNNKLGVQG
ncbi:MAG: BON domain-containing protein [Pseudomonadota bacterium]